MSPALASRGPNASRTSSTATARRYACDMVVNAAGAWSRKIAQMVDIDIPVYARRRSIFNVTSPARLERLSAADRSDRRVLPPGRATRSFAARHRARINDPDDLPLDEVDHALFDDVIWPTLAHRVPEFEALRVQNCWSGYYEYNVLDQNAIIGYHPRRRKLRFRQRLQRAWSAAGPGNGPRRQRTDPAWPLHDARSRLAELCACARKPTDRGEERGVAARRAMGKRNEAC